jgi:hypothetical protein
MPKVPTFPTLYQDCNILRVSLLVKWGYLKPSGFHSGVITWKRHGAAMASIQADASTILQPWVIALSYNYRSKPFREEIKISSLPSNLGRGRVLYFICPVTGARCRNLYLHNGRFVHRKAVPGAMYESQTYSHISRGYCRLFGAYFGQDKAYQLLSKKGFKRQYKGRPTKGYKRALQMIEAGNGISLEALLAGLGSEKVKK